MSGRKRTRKPLPEPTGAAQLTPDETMCVLSACVQGLANFMGAGELDAEDRESFEQLKEATIKIARGVGMTLEELSTFAAYASGDITQEDVHRVIQSVRHGDGDTRNLS